MALVTFKRDFYDKFGKFWEHQKGPFEIKDEELLSSLPSDATYEGKPVVKPTKEEKVKL